MTDFVRRANYSVRAWWGLAFAFGVAFWTLLFQVAVPLVLRAV